MLVIKEFEDILETLKQQGKPYWKVSSKQANPRMFEAYCKSQEEQKELLDFDEPIWEEDILPIAEKCRQFGIKQFTISVRQSNLIDILTDFQNAGITIQGMTKFHALCGGITDRVVSAFLMNVQD